MYSSLKTSNPERAWRIGSRDLNRTSTPGGESAKFYDGLDAVRSYFRKRPGELDKKRNFRVPCRNSFYPFFC
jgi:hypothetical protein